MSRQKLKSVPAKDGLLGGHQALAEGGDLRDPAVRRVANLEGIAFGAFEFFPPLARYV